MLTENTGIALCDSGGVDGRGWQRNQKRTLQDFINEPSVSYDRPTEPTTSDDLLPTVSIFHYLPTVLELDDVCNEFNRLPCKAFDGAAFGIDRRQTTFLKKHGFTFGSSWNTYNGESTLSQILQGTNLLVDGCGEGEYILLQIHNGCDARGGYTDAKLFKLQRFQEFINPCPEIFGDIDSIQVDTFYDGINLRTEDGKPVPVRPDSIINLWLSNE